MIPLETFHAILTFLFTGNAIISIFAYIPQIATLIQATGRSESVSISSWFLWFYTGMVGTFYSIFVLHDTPAIVVNIVSDVGIVTVLSLTIYNRYFRFAETLPHGISTTTAHQM
ncbi:MAG: hypothetical protein WAZ18_07375, partial [Alphaproteobacteria bacterium]